MRRPCHVVPSLCIVLEALVPQLLCPLVGTPTPRMAQLIPVSLFSSARQESTVWTAPGLRVQLEGTAERRAKWYAPSVHQGMRALLEQACCLF